MNQNDWSSLLAAYPYTESFIQGWQTADRSGDPYWPGYEEALNVYLASRDDRRRLTDRYTSLNDSHRRFQYLNTQGDEHLATRLALIRIQADLGEQQAVVSECRRLFEQMPWLQEELSADKQIEIDRPFIAPLSDDDYRDISNGLNNWLRVAIREILRRFDATAEENLNRSTESPACPILPQPQNPAINADFQQAFHKDQTTETNLTAANDLSPQEHDKSAILFRQSIGLDRNDVSAYLGYARILSKTGEDLTAWLTFNEAKRLAPLSSSDQEKMDQLDVDLSDPDVQKYLERAGEIPITRSDAPKKILIITNLLPPQEMGGFGRTVWEFCRTLIQRGHELSILTADMPHLYREASEDIRIVEQKVTRDLRLFGDWKGGRTVTDTSTTVIQQKMRHNHQRILAEVERFRPDGCLVGNLDFVGHEFLDPILQQGIPVIHRLGNSLPGYPVEATPQSRLYCMAGATEWLNLQLKAKGYAFPNQAVVYPASTVETYYRYYPPAFDALRICFAGLLMPYKGAQILVQSLVILQNQDIPFTCELAGDTTDPSFVESLMTIAQRQGFADRLHLTGFLSRKELAALYARSNVMVFPSLFDEPFGKSQIEAMAAGLAVVSSGTGGAREIISDGKNGWIFETDSPTDLANKLVSLHRNADRTRQIAEQGHEDSFRFTTMRSVEKIEQIFEILTMAHKGRQLNSIQPSSLSHSINLTRRKKLKHACEASAAPKISVGNNPWLATTLGILAANRPLHPKPHGLPHPLIVSLTSFPKRFSTLPLTLQSLTTQTMAPNRIVLWIAYDDRNSLTKDLLEFDGNGVEIRFCEDLKSYKKIIPALHEFPDHFIVTADDDFYYWPTWLEELVECYDPQELNLPAHRTHRIRLNDNGMPLPYMDWTWNQREDISGHILNFPTGCGGVFYAPHCFDVDVTNTSLFSELCPTADDIWLYWMAIKAGYLFKPTGTGNKLVNWPFSQEVNLSASNCANGNDLQITGINGYYKTFPFDMKVNPSDLSDRNIIVTGLPRSGTSLLCVLLNAMPNVLCINEVFYDVENLPLAFSDVRQRLEKGQPIPNKFDEKEELTTDTQRNPCILSERVMNDVNANAVIASKVNIPYLNQIDKILFMGFKVIALIRDPVYTIASWRSDKVKNIPEAMVEDGNMHPRWRGFRFASTDPLVRQAQIWEHYAALLLSKRDRLLLVRYEDLTDYPDKTLTIIASEIGRDYSATPPLQNKNSPHRFEDLTEIKDVVSVYCQSAERLGYLSRATSYKTDYDASQYWEYRGNNYWVDKREYSSDIEIENLKDTILRLGLSGHAILEIGSGYGRVWEMINIHMPNFTMCDFANSMRKGCQERTGILPDYWNGEILPYGESAFDLVILFSVLLHVPPQSIDRFIKEVARVTNRYIYIATNATNPGQCLASHVFCHDYEHLFSSNGFHVIESKIYNQGNRINWLLEKIDCTMTKNKINTLSPEPLSRLAELLKKVR